MKRLHYYLIVGFLVASAIGKAQITKKPLITGDFNHSNMEEFIKALERQTNYTFYYDPAQVDSFFVTMNVKEMTLDEVLKTTFLNTDYFASIDSDHHVFLTKGAPILTGFPATGTPIPQDSIKYAPLFDQIKANSSNKSFTNEKLYRVGIKSKNAKTNAEVLVYVVSDRTKEALKDISFTLDGKAAHVITDSNGVNKLSVTKGNHTLAISSFGKKTAIRHLVVYSDGILAVEMEDEIKVLEDVLVSAQRTTNLNRALLGVERLNIKSIKKVPAVFGEADVLRVILTLPGVKSVGEASTGFNVRGGATDQNLILFNDATIYNPSHFFGFFSAFNPDIVKDVELFKSSIPAQYGGRLSSVLNVTGREGNKNKVTGTAGVGLLTSRINVEGPIVKDKTSFNFGARTTYANWLLNLLPDRYDNSKASFYDANLLLSHKINERNDLYLSGYISHDKFRLGNDTAYGYQNKSVSLKWRHRFSGKIESTFIFGYDGYAYFNTSENNSVNAYRMEFDVSQWNAKGDFTYTVNTKHTIGFGLSSIAYKLHPGSFTPVGPASLVTPDIIAAEQALETAVYVSDRYEVNDKLSLSGGLRYSRFDNLGPQSVNKYAANLPKDEASLIEEKDFGSGKIIKTYQGPEVRLTAKYSIGKSASVKAGYNTLRQYIHMLSNTTAISPTDIWKLSDFNIQPQLGNQLSLGLFKNFREGSVETSVEVYYKHLKNILDYKSGAQLVLNPHIETDVINTTGKAYGVEFMLKKRAGKLNGWVSYTYSRTLLKMDDINIGALVNKGAFYPSSYDKPHDATLVGNYAINQRLSLSLNVTYSTGRPITLPIGRYYYSGSQRALYGDRNANRIPDYFRSDFSMNIEGNHKVHQLTHNSFTIGVYNLTGRKNPYSVYYTTENGRINGYKLSIFGSAIPFINYNIRF